MSDNEAREIANLIKNAKVGEDETVGQRLYDDFSKMKPEEFQNLLKQVQVENAKDLAVNKDLPSVQISDDGKQVALLSDGRFGIGNQQVAFDDLPKGSKTINIGGYSGEEDPGLFVAEKGAVVTARHGSHIIAKNGSFFMAYDGGSVVAKDGSIGFAQPGSNVIEEPGSHVFEDPGSHVVKVDKDTKE